MTDHPNPEQVCVCGHDVEEHTGPDTACGAPVVRLGVVVCCWCPQFAAQELPDTDRIIDDIDRLVDEQLEQEPSGYDHNINQPKCPHCPRNWHGLRITERIEQMRRRGVYDESYRVADDTTAVLCEGSDFIGPPRPPAANRGSAGITWRVTRESPPSRVNAPTLIFDEPALQFPRVPAPAPRRWWRTEGTPDFTVNRDEINNLATIVRAGQPGAVAYLPLADIHQERDPDGRWWIDTRDEMPADHWGFGRWPLTEAGDTTHPNQTRVAELVTNVLNDVMDTLTAVLGLPPIDDDLLNPESWILPADPVTDAGLADAGWQNVGTIVGDGPEIRR